MKDGRERITLELESNSTRSCQELAKDNGIRDAQHFKSRFIQLRVEISCSNVHVFQMQIRDSRRSDIFEKDGGCQARSGGGTK